MQEQVNLLKASLRGSGGTGWVGCSQLINYSLQPKATDVITEHSLASHNGRESVYTTSTKIQNI